MQTLALISFYAPVLIIILAVLATLFSFFCVFLPLPGWALKRQWADCWFESGAGASGGDADTNRPPKKN